MASLISSVEPPGALLARIAQAGAADPVAPAWADAARAARPLVGEISALRDRLRLAGIGRVLLAASGGTGVAAQVLAGADARLTVLDGTDPVQVADALAGDLEGTVLVVSAPDGPGAAGVELVWRVVTEAMQAEGLDAARADGARRTRRQLDDLPWRRGPPS